MNPISYLMMYFSSKIPAKVQEKDVLRLPTFYNALKFISQLAFFAGCLFGISTVVTGYKYLERSQDMGLMTMLTGVVAILSAIVFLGLINGFLSIVKTQIETRNAIIELVEATKNKSMTD